MPCSFRDRILGELWRESAPAAGRIWAVLDAARDERIYTAIQNSDLDKCCLFSGQVHPVLRSAAPHLVRLGHDHRLTRHLIDEGWGEHWGVFFQADASLDELRRHLRQFLRVRDEERRRLFFRFYDPRVLRAYLPTCTTEELRIFFSPINRFVTEGEDPATLMHFTFEAGRLMEQEVRLELAAQAAIR